MYLQSIEDDNYKTLPGGIFNKGFLRSYAKYVGLDEQEALQDYALLIAQHEESVDDSQPKYRPEVLTDDAHSAASIVPTVVFAGIILALMTGGILFVVSYIRNQPANPTAVSNASNTGSNMGANVDTNATNSLSNPAGAQIRVDFRALAEKVSVTSTVDGNLAYDEITSDAPKTYTAQEGLKLRYYRGFADKVQISLNGKELTPPPAPVKGNIEIDINKENVARIFESGRIAPAEPGVAETASPASVPSPVRTGSTPAAPTPRPSVSAPHPAFTPIPTPRRSPAPIIVGRPPATTPLPN